MESKTVALGLVLVGLCALASAKSVLPPPEQGLQKVQVTSDGIGTRAVSFFYFSTFALGFNDAVAYCRQSGLELVNIKTHAKQNEVRATMFELDNRNPQWINIWWRNSAWYWGDSSRALYTNFAFTNTGSGYRHYLNPNNDYLWGAESIGHNMFFICENVY